MGCLKSIKEAVKGFDLFSRNISLRYEDDMDYTTFTGGVGSILLITLFIVIFASTVVSAFGKEEITSTTSFFEEKHPSLFKIGVDKFMFAVGITDIDMNKDERRWFDIQMEFRHY